MKTTKDLIVHAEHREEEIRAKNPGHSAQAIQRIVSNELKVDRADTKGKEAKAQYTEVIEAIEFAIDQARTAKPNSLPFYRAHTGYFKPAHVIGNTDIHQLYEFFNPKVNQVCIFGNKGGSGHKIPLLLEALGFNVNWDEDGDSFKVEIPAAFRTRKIMQEVTETW